MQVKSQKFCAWTGPIGCILMFIGLLLMGFLPLPRPGLSADEFATLYRSNPTGIIIGSILFQLGGALWCAFAAIISVHMKRIEGTSSPWAYTQMLAGLMGFLPILLGAIFFTVAAYRPERSPETIQLLSDLAFIGFVMPALPGLVQLMSIGIATLGDKRPKPVFPRWVGYLNIWTAILYIPGCLIGLFHSGPFGWNGALAFWLVAVAFGNWVNVMCMVLLKAIKAQALEEKHVRELEHA
jgi:hypothetical protein